MPYESAVKNEEYSSNRHQSQGLQAGVRVGSAWNPAEAEADRVASQVTGFSRQSRALSSDGGGTDGFSGVQRSVSDGAASMGAGFDLAGDFRSELASSRKSKLSPYLNNMLGSKLGADFSDVNVHTDEKAGEMAADMGASAFTLGRDVYFGEGAYRPGSPSGDSLIAHELTHTIQQGAVPQKADSAVPVQQGASSGTVMRDFLGFAKRYRKAEDERNLNEASYKSAPWYKRAQWTIMNPLAAGNAGSTSSILMTALRQARSEKIEEVFVNDPMTEKKGDTDEQKAAKTKARDQKEATEKRVGGYQSAPQGATPAAWQKGKTMVGSNRDQAAGSSKFMEGVDDITGKAEILPELTGSGLDLGGAAYDASMSVPYAEWTKQSKNFEELIAAGKEKGSDISGLETQKGDIDAKIKDVDKIGAGIGIGTSALGMAGGALGTYSSGRDAFNRFRQGNTTGGIKKSVDAVGSATSTLGSTFSLFENIGTLAGGAWDADWLGPAATWTNLAAGGITFGTGAVTMSKESWKLHRNSSLQRDLAKRLQADDDNTKVMEDLAKAIKDEKEIIEKMTKALDKLADEADELNKIEKKINDLEKEKDELDKKKTGDEKDKAIDDRIADIDKELDDLRPKVYVDSKGKKTNKAEVLREKLDEDGVNLQKSKKALALKKKELGERQGNPVDRDKLETLMAMNRMRKNLAKGRMVSGSINLAKGGIALAQGIMKLTGVSDTVAGKVVGAVLTVAGVGLGLAGGKITDAVKRHYQKVEVNKSLNVDKRAKELAGSKKDNTLKSFTSEQKNKAKENAAKIAIKMKDSLGEETASASGTTPATYSTTELNKTAAPMLQKLAPKVLDKPLSAVEAKRVILKREGYKSGKKKEAFLDLAQTRVDKIMGMTDPKDMDAKQTRSALGMSSKSTNQKALNTLGVGHDEGTDMGDAFKKLNAPEPSWA